MNLSEWSYSLYPNYYPYLYNTNLMLNSSIGTNLNSSSGYESAGNDSSLIEPCFLLAKVRKDTRFNSLIFRLYFRKNNQM